jgi:hypothetical protein
MDSLNEYRQIIQEILREYAKIPYAYGDLEQQVIIDNNQDNYLLITMGWENQKRVHGCLVHLQIIDDKIWIQRDGIEDGIATDLVAAGIPKNKIVLAFKPEHIRAYTEFAIK